MKWWMWPIGALVLFVLWALLRTPSPEEEAKHRDRASIQLCWEEQQRKSLDPASARLVAGWCEDMERSFKTRFGVAP